MWRVLASLLGAGVVLFAQPAAASTPPVHLEVEHCESLDETSIRRIFAADLGAPTTVEVGPEVTEVSVSCEGERVVVRVKDPLSRKTLRRSFDPKSFGNQGQSRLIAIAASELVLASWAELADNPTPTVLGEGEPAKPETLETARGVVKAHNAEHQRATTPETSVTPLGIEPAPTAKPPPAPRTLEGPPAPAASESGSKYETPVDRLSNSPNPHPVFERAMAVVSVRAFTSGDAVLVGGGARLAQDRYSVVAWAADALVESGKIKGRSATSASIGGSLAFYLHKEPVTFRLGGGLRGGMLGLATGAAVAPWGWPMAVTSFTVRSGPFVMDLGAEGGFADLLLPRSQSVHGAWASGQFGFGLVL